MAFLYASRAGTQSSLSGVLSWRAQSRCLIARSMHLMLLDWIGSFLVCITLLRMLLACCLRTLISMGSLVVWRIHIRSMSSGFQYLTTHRCSASREVSRRHLTLTIPRTHSRRDRVHRTSSPTSLLVLHRNCSRVFQYLVRGRTALIDRIVIFLMG